MEEPSTVRLGKDSDPTLYDLIEEAGSGGMGTVFRARDRKSGGIAAVKVLRAGGDAVRFALEASALSRLSHPNIVAYIGHGLREDGAQFLAMEWLEGECLDDLLTRGPVPLRRILEIARDVAAGLAHAHENGVVHRDLKPRNVFVTEGGAKILDFGVARVANDIGLTHTGQVIGTPKYMAPEQAGGTGTVGPRADLFSLGCILYRAVAGVTPFEADDVMGVLKRLATETPPRLTGVPNGVADLVARLLEKDPELRPRSADDVRATLDALLKTDLSVPPPAPAEEIERTLHSNEVTPTLSTRSKRVPRVVVLALVAFALGAAVWIARAKLRGHASPDRAGVARACRVWSDELARRQLSDGSFTGDPKRDASGWDTGMVLAALERASSCASVSPASLRSATDALERLEQPGGWAGPAGKVEAPADAWAALALALTSRHDARTRTAALAARDVLVSVQRPDGAFGLRTASDPPSPYVTMIAAWALVESEKLDGAAIARAARKGALEQLRVAFRSQGNDVRGTPGFEEELLWVLAEARRVSPDERGGDDVLRDGAADLIARCVLDRTDACTHPPYGENRAKLDPTLPADEGILVFWLPWVGATADAIARSDVELAPNVRADLERIAQWAAGMFARNVDVLGAFPAYSLAEYVAAASSLADAH